VAVVNHHRRAVSVGQIAYTAQIGDNPVHRENAVGNDQFNPRPAFGGFL
jgi:hypothetical protein